MKKLIDTIKNIWSIKDLRQRILYTLGLLFVFRLGSYVVLPGVISSVLDNVASSRSPNDLLGLINTFTGGAFNQASIFALGIMPYITASIIVQILGFAVPYFQRLQSKEGESGRKKLNQITRLLTLGITLVQGGAYLTYLKGVGAISPSVPIGIFWISNILILTTGTTFAMWLGEKITDKGVGNGVSILIMIGIISRLPGAIIFEFNAQLASSGLIMFILELAILFVIIVFTILIVQGVRKIPLSYPKKAIGGGSMAAGNREYIPLKVNAAGVMPIIFAQALMFLPAIVAQYAVGSNTSTSILIRSLNDHFSFTYNLIYFVLIIVFTYVYTALLVNPQSYAEWLKRSNAYIPGVKPGKDTESYIDAITSKITFPGSVILGIIAILPAIIINFGVNQSFALFFGGTSLLIMVGVILDMLSQIESYLLMRKYDGLVSSGQIQSRASGGIQIGY
ncbi:MAG TPA: preprotein translocase subunit SecY [Saprospiraceae bacterium]|nr:preprotein translocase subunit SecY [Saprospiraceae bacterium]HQW54686.1 preprotein translocase subunit SecY [Saprospiraceae bacterium]